MKTRLRLSPRAFVAAFLLVPAFIAIGGVRGADARSCGPCPVVTTDDLNLRTAPSLEATIIWVIPAGTELSAENESTNGFRQVEVQGLEGWAYGLYLVSTDAPDASGTRTTTDYLNLRQSPSTDAEMLDVMLPLTVVESTDQVVSGFRFVYYDGLPGWAFDQYLAESSTMTTTDYLNLRVDPDTSSKIFLVMPVGTTVQLTGDESNGFVSVTYNGVDGWAYRAYLA
jgi:uncharacterized protein YgiM (DUF1202 family)